MKIGFTGTRNGMTEKQQQEVRRILEDSQPTEAHHGDCVGADEEFHQICVDLGIDTFIHPPIKPDLRAFCSGDVEYEPKEYLQRNRAIVNSADVMLATPSTNKRSRGGTWYTINYSLTVEKPTRIIYP